MSWTNDFASADKGVAKNWTSFIYSKLDEDF